MGSGGALIDPLEREARDGQWAGKGLLRALVYGLQSTAQYDDEEDDDEDDVDDVGDGACYVFLLRVLLVMLTLAATFAS